MGREMSLAFARAGWSVACHYLRSAQAAETLCEEVRALGVSAMAVPGELADEASTRRMFDTVVAKTGLSLQCVVNNASLFEPDTGRDFQEDLALAQMRVNLMAPMRLGKWLAVLHEGRGSPRYARDDVSKTAASTTRGAVSARNTRGPSVTGAKPAARACASSVGLKPPSGPLSTTKGPSPCVAWAKGCVPSASDNTQRWPCTVGIFNHSLRLQAS